VRSRITGDACISKKKKVAVISNKTLDYLHYCRNTPSGSTCHKICEHAIMTIEVT